MHILAGIPVLPKSSEAARPVNIRDSATPTVAFLWGIEAAGRQIRNPKFEIRNSARVEHPASSIEHRQAPSPKPQAKKRRRWAAPLQDGNEVD